MAVPLQRGPRGPCSACREGASDSLLLPSGPDILSVLGWLWEREICQVKYGFVLPHVHVECPRPLLLWSLGVPG